MRPLFLSLVLLLPSFALADTHHWRPTATPTTQRSTLTFAGTYAATDTVTITVGNSDLVITVGTNASTTAIAEDVKEAINAADTTSKLGTGYFRSAGGQDIPTFTEIEATVDGSVVTAYAKTPGKPFTIAATEDAAAGSVAVSTAQAATGPYHFDNADNWTGGAVPADGDTAYFDAGSGDCKYALDDLRDNTKIVSVIVTTDYTGQIGLDRLNTDASSSANRYVEYRDRFLELYDPNAASPTDLVIETGNRSGGGGRYLFDLQGQDFDEVLIRNGGNLGPVPNVELHGGSISTLYIGAGWVLVDPDDAGQSAGATIDAVRIGPKSANLLVPRVVFGRLTRWNSSGTNGQRLLGPGRVRLSARYRHACGQSHHLRWPRHGTG